MRANPTNGMESVFDVSPRKGDSVGFPAEYLEWARHEYDNGTLTRAYMFGWRSLGYSWGESIRKARELEVPPIQF